EARQGLEADQGHERVGRARQVITAEGVPDARAGARAAGTAGRPVGERVAVVVDERLTDRAQAVDAVRVAAVGDTRIAAAVVRVAEVMNRAGGIAVVHRAVHVGGRLVVPVARRRTDVA